MSDASDAGLEQDGDLGAADPLPWDMPTTPEDIYGEFLRLPGHLARALAVYADAAAAVLRAERERDREWARMYLACKATTPKPTEEVAKAMVELQPAYQAADDALADAQAHKLRSHAAVEAVKAKQDMLVSLGAHLRAELKGNPLIREGGRGSREVEEARR